MPQEFKDHTGKVWTLALTGASVRRCAERIKCDLNSVTNTGTIPAIGQITNSDAVLAEVLYCICRPQCERSTPPLSEDDFGERLCGDVLAAAETAFYEEWCFFCRQRGNPQMAEVIAAARQLSRTTYDAFLENLAAVQSRLDDAEPGRTSGKSAVSTPQLPDATPSPERSEN